MNLTRDPGTYALVLFLGRRSKIPIGALGIRDLPRGVYIYFGSALNGLEGRLARHLRRDKRLFWHIDYLLTKAQVADVWYSPGRTRHECDWAKSALALPNARVIVPHFGSSDCRCPSHLVYLSSGVLDAVRS